MAVQGSVISIVITVVKSIIRMVRVTVDIYYVPVGEILDCNAVVEVLDVDLILINKEIPLVEEGN